MESSLPGSLAAGPKAVVGATQRQPSLLPRQRTFVYVDGFNLYYRCLKGTPHKWLDLPRLFGNILRPTNEIVRVRYFTADVSGKRDPSAPERQQTYLRALSTLPQITIHKGSFLVSKRWAALAAPPEKFVKPDPVTVFVLKTEEKGSAVVVSNDTDLVAPIRIVVAELGKPVGLICPAPSPARSLTRVASFCRYITPGRLAAAQLPDSIPGTTIRRPSAW